MKRYILDRLSYLFGVILILTLVSATTQIRVGQLKTTGTPDGTKFLRDDGAWAAPSASVADGDKGDVVVSSSGAAWTLEDAFKKTPAQRIGDALGGAVLAEPFLPLIAASTSTSQPTNNLRFVAVYLPVNATITGVKWLQTTQGVYTATNYNGVGLYTYSGGTLTLVASSTDDGNIWKGSAGVQSKAFSSTYSATAGVYFIAALYCSSSVTTGPAIAAFPATSAMASFDFTNSGKAWGALSAQSTMPATITLSSASTANVVYALGLY